MNIDLKSNTTSARARPVYIYSASVEASASASGASGEVVSLGFGEFKRICRYGRGGRCKETKARCEPGFCPQIQKKD